MRKTIPNRRADDLQEALDQMRSLMLDGLRHGFFEYSVSCETVKDCKRQLIIRAGKSHKYYIAPEQIDE